MLKTENLIPRTRFFVLSGMVLIVLFILVLRFFQLQILSYEKYRLKSEANIIRPHSIQAPRGVIYDREGYILVDNHPTYILTAIPIELQDRESTFNNINRHLGIGIDVLESNYQKNYRGRFIPTRLVKDLTIQQISRVAEHSADLPGISYIQVPERYYPADIHLSHTLGYIREVDRKFLETSTQKDKYRLGDMKGWSGLEKMYEPILRGKDGVNYMQVDAYGREVEQLIELQDVKPIPGDDLYLFIDSDIQALAEQELVGYRGVIIVSDPLSGEILAIASAPDYPPDLFTGLTLQDRWQQYAEDQTKPLHNRILNGQYPPGSTFKPLVMLGLLEHELVDTNQTITCNGHYRLGRRTFECWNPAGHGKVNLRKAIQQSCNVYFYNMIQKMELDDWAAICQEFGFGMEVNIDLPGESVGVIPCVEFMNKKYGEKKWTRGHLLNIGIGQGDILVTPLQMCRFINQVITKGTSPPLKIASKNQISDQNNSINFKDEYWQLLLDYMRMVTQSSEGTGKLAEPKIEGVDTGGKTGTAENPHGEPHAWFIGWAKGQEKTITVTILLENSGHGGDVAAPIARKIYRKFFRKYQSSSS